MRSVITKISLCFIVVCSLCLYINNMCYSMMYENDRYNFELWIPDNFVYNGPPFVTPSPDVVMEALDPNDNTNVVVQVKYVRSTPSGGAETKGNRLVYAKNILKKEYQKNGLNILDDNIVYLSNGHEGYYFVYRVASNGILFEQRSAQIWIHSRLYTLTYTRKIQSDRNDDIVRSLNSFTCNEE